MIFVIDFSIWDVTTERDDIVMSRTFNEDTWVKVPATIQFLRIGYDYQSLSNAEIDFEDITKNDFAYADERTGGVWGGLRVMTYNVIIAIVLIAIAAVVYFINLFRGKEEDSVSNTLTFTGIGLIASGIPTISDAAIDAIFQLLKFQSPENEGGYLLRVIVGFILIVLGLILKFNLKKRVYVLNMYGIAAQKNIDDLKLLVI